MSRSALVVGVDCSTTACKAIAWDEAGCPVAEGKAAIDLDHPAPDGWEQDAEQWWSAWLAAVGEVGAALGEASARVRSLSIAHQRETVVLAGDDGRPLHPARVWMDGRCHEQVREATARLGAERIDELSGKPPCTTPSLYKVMHLFAEHPQLRLARPLVLDVHAFLAWRATGRRATSLASADPTGLVDMKARAWADELVGLLGIGEQQLPELVEPMEELGRLRPSVAAACGMPPELPVIAGAGDGQAAGLGAGIDGTGRAYVNLGTAVVAGLLVHRYQRHHAFRTLYGAVPGTFVCESDLKAGTFTLDWLCGQLLGLPGRDARDLEAMRTELERAAGVIPAGSGGLVLVPYLHGVMNPYWDDEARGILVGLAGGHQPAHLYRAVLEGVAFEQRLALDGMAAVTGPVEELVVFGGGARSDLWCQILADVTSRRVVRSATFEATALGAGMMAAVGIGLYRSPLQAVQGMTRTERCFEPGPNEAHYAELYSQVYRELYPSLRTALRRLAGLRRRG